MAEKRALATLSCFKSRASGSLTFDYNWLRQPLCTYPRTVAECLRPGGHWLNVGPLNYHVHDGRDGGGGEPAAAIPLSWETLRSAILDSGRQSIA